MTLHPIRVSLQWMGEGDYILGWSDGSTWNTWEHVWLDLPAVHALDQLCQDTGYSLFDEVDDGARLAFQDGELVEVQVDGEVSPLPRGVHHGQRIWDFQGWTFQAAPTFQPTTAPRCLREHDSHGFHLDVPLRAQVNPCDLHAQDAADQDEEPDGGVIKFAPGTVFLDPDTGEFSRE